MPNCKRTHGSLAALVGGVCIVTLCHGRLLAEPPPSGDVQASERVDFFEKQVRPVLASQCYACHGPKKQQSGLRLDSRESLLRGGERGPAVVPGKPGESLLISAVRQAGDLKMPPESKLSEPQIAALMQWVELGAPWPDTPAPLVQKADAKTHWAFQPVRDPAVPAVDGLPGSSRPPLATNPIDAFVLARLAAAGLEPPPEADARTLIRRATFDLTGLPPTPEEVAEFEQSAIRKSQSAIESLVDRLLGSPHYGEQWARHWLDVARYADTKGYVYAREERFWVHAWAYRDWVVRALNEDLPYNRFLLLQIAADQVAPDDPSSLAAMGFLTLGRRFLGVTHDIIDDRIDVVTRGTMGLTVACARCHDHKYDPIPTRDYYSLYGVFANCRERVLPIAQPAGKDESYQAFEKELRQRQQKLNEEMAAARADWTIRTRGRAADYLFAQFELHKYPEDTFNQVFSKDDILPSYVRQWQAWLTQAREQGDPVFAAWHAYAQIPPDEFSQRSAEVTHSLLARSATEINPLVARRFTTPPASMQEVCQRYGELFAEIEAQWQAAAKEAKEAGRSPPEALPEPAAEALRQVLYDPQAPCVVPEEPIVHTENYFDLKACEELWKLQGEVDRWLIRTAAAPAHAVILKDREPTIPARVFRRGDPKQKGDVTPRQFLEVLSGRDRRPFQHGSGRLELAREIVDPGNPLTARVIVNRVWQGHFGAGLVRTPSDFGMRAEPPSHPELLDWLASRFVEDGWSIKQLHRRIMLSNVYRQSSIGPADSVQRAKAQQLDPQNRLLWRMNVRRLSFEEMRDALLAASGKLQMQMGGRPGDMFNATFQRRTLYGLVDRQFLPTTLRVFDFANPDLHIPVRSETTAPQQALFFLNHPLLLQQAQALARRLAEPRSLGGFLRNPQPISEKSAYTDEEKVRELYRLVYQRAPTPGQAAAALDLVRSAAQEPAPVIPATVADWRYGYGEYDEESKQVRNLQPLPHFTGKAWQGGPQWPDAKLGWVQLTAEGGHAGNDRKHAAVRRWVAPEDMTVRIVSLLAHDTKQGDGVRGFLVHGRQGLLKSTAVHHSKAQLDVADLEMRQGDTLDFVVDLGDGLNNDQFTWTVEIAPATGDRPGGEVVWIARRDFGGLATVRLGPWEQLAQVLLAANEFVFVD